MALSISYQREFFPSWWNAETPARTGKTSYDVIDILPEGNFPFLVELWPFTFDRKECYL